MNSKINALYLKADWLNFKTVLGFLSVPLQLGLHRPTGLDYSSRTNSEQLSQTIYSNKLKKLTGSYIYVL